MYDLSLKPILISDIQVYEDPRGCFFESYKLSHFRNEAKIKDSFVQDNHSISKKNVIRGLHYQWDPPMGKLVRVAKGSILDVVVDIRKDSAEFGKVHKFELSDLNKYQLYVPPGFAHGFVSQVEESIVLYKCTSEYNRLGESGINPFDLQLNIDWGIHKKEAIVSDKDLSAKTLEEYKNE